METQIHDYIEKLKDERTQLFAQLRFMIDHKFTHEEKHIQTKLDVITEIIDSLIQVLNGNKKGNSVTFRF